MGSIPSSSQTKRLKMLLFTASLLDVQHWRDGGENKLVSSLVVPLGKALIGIPLPLWVVVQVVTDGSGGEAQLVERGDSNRKVVKPWFDSDAVARRVSLRRRLIPSWGQEVYPLWWPNLTKHCKQDHSVLEWYDRHRA